VTSPARAARGGTLFLMPEAFRRHGGIQTHNRDQVQALRRCRPDEPLTLLVLNDTADDVRQPEWRGLVAEGWSRRRARYAWRSLVCAWRQQPARVLVGHRNFLPLLPLLALAAPRSQRWLLAYGVEIERPFGGFTRLLLSCVTCVYAVSPYTAGRVRDAGWRGPTRLWPCSLSFAWPLPEPAPPRLEPPLRLLSVARLAPPERHKGLDDTLRALARLAGAGHEARLDVVGEGDDRARLEALARELGLVSRVTFHGAAAPEALRRLYAACDVFVLPSAGEGFGIVYLEALAHAKPVVAADAGGAPFVVRPGQSGWLVPYGDPARLAACVAEIAARPDEARAVALRGRRMLEREFTFEHLVGVTARLLDGGR
jgi:glycosyltransferase involved in cell wall biosynthesis